MGRFFPARFVLSGATVTNRAALGLHAGLDLHLPGRELPARLHAHGAEHRRHHHRQLQRRLRQARPHGGRRLEPRRARRQHHLQHRQRRACRSAPPAAAGRAAVAARHAQRRRAARERARRAVQCRLRHRPHRQRRRGDGLVRHGQQRQRPNDRSTVGTLALRFGRLALLNAIGAADRALALPALAQYWNGSAFADNTLDSCTTVPAAAVSFGNLRRTLTTADTAVASPITITGGRGSLRLAAPSGGRSGSVDVALSLGSSATDASCLQPWTPGAGDAATAGANLAYLRGAWCSSSYDKDPSARATFGQQRGHEALLYRRENY
ncbi:MAG: spore coat U domain-containing protein [Comamonadaceae bacterium]|nr:spore coat U domain-containing protein [Comamonadaceae bacterium]